MHVIKQKFVHPSSHLSLVTFCPCGFMVCEEGITRRRSGTSGRSERTPSENTHKLAKYKRTVRILLSITSVFWLPVYHRGVSSKYTQSARYDSTFTGQNSFSFSNIISHSPFISIVTRPSICNGYLGYAMKDDAVEADFTSNESKGRIVEIRFKNKSHQRNNTQS